MLQITFASIVGLFKTLQSSQMLQLHRNRCGPPGQVPLLSGSHHPITRQPPLPRLPTPPGLFSFVMDSSLLTSCRSLVTRSPKWPLRKSVAVLRGWGKSQATAQLSSFGGTLPRVAQPRPGLYRCLPAGVPSVLSLAGMQRRTPLIRSESRGNIPISRGNPCQVSASLSYGTREVFLVAWVSVVVWFGLVWPFSSPSNQHCFPHSWIWYQVSPSPSPPRRLLHRAYLILQRPQPPR